MQAKSGGRSRGWRWGGQRVTRDATSPAGSCGSWVSERDNGGVGFTRGHLQLNFFLLVNKKCEVRTDWPLFTPVHSGIKGCSKDAACLPHCHAGLKYSTPASKKNSLRNRAVCISQSDGMDNNPISLHGQTVRKQQQSVRFRTDSERSHFLAAPQYVWDEGGKHAT